MKISFELTMPNVGSWNGKWTGAAKKYFVIRGFRATDGNKLIGSIFMEGPKARFYYNFGDGWGANVTAEIVDAVEARKRSKQSAGFCGYEWMIDSIIKHGKILVEDKTVPA